MVDGQIVLGPLFSDSSYKYRLVANFSALEDQFWPKFSIFSTRGVRIGSKLPKKYIFFYHTFSVKRLHRLTNYKESSPEGLSMLNMLPPLLRINLVTLWVLYFSPFRYQFYWLVYRSNVSVKCLAQEHNKVVIFARGSPTLNQIRLDVAYLL